ncbi:hypothetical protein MNBD_GAMMA15-2612 [hydrothermal vent metagenome]|uniref:Uncharacterized protein n=1 Tax=hydrothermal vent metagenome TaxID=652676 RepID=A0A3B0Z0T5_9ZZZZ
MTTSKQKRVELEQLEKALTLLNIDDYVVLDKENESPDFIIKVGSETVGVEVTEVYRKYTNGNSAKTESDLPVIIEEAIKLYNQSGGAPYAFGFGFNGEAAVAQRNNVIKELGEFLYQYSVNNLVDDDIGIQEIKIDTNKFPLLAIVNSIHAKITNKPVAVAFTVSSFGSEEIDKDTIRSVILSKAKKVTGYKQRCKAIWLLIVLPSMALSGDFFLSDEKINIQINGFDAVYVIDNYRDQIQCVNQA